MRKNFTIVCLLVLALVVGGLSALAQAAETGTHVHKTQAASDKSWGETFKDIWTRDKLTGDWGGLRTDLADHGFYPSVRLSQFYQNVASGGRDQKGRYGGLVDWRANVDAEKLFGLWKGLGLSLHAQTRFGKDVLAEGGPFTLPNAALLYPLPGDFAGTNITGITVAQTVPVPLIDGNLTALFGKLHAFDLVDGFFPQVGSGQEGFMNVNSLVTALPWFRWVTLSMWGGGAWTTNKEGQVTGGVLALGQANVSDTWHGWNDSFGDGVGLFGFYRYFYKLSDKPGYLLGAAGTSTKKFGSTDSTDITFLPGAGLSDDKTKHPWDFAAYLYQVFWQADGDAKRYANVFIGGTIADDNPSFSNANLFMNIEAHGLFAARPHDRMGIAGYWNRLASNYVDKVDRLPILNVRQHLYGFEAYYNIAINPWLHLSPDIQLARVANKKDDLAVIPGVRLVMDF